VESHDAQAALELSRQQFNEEMEIAKEQNDPEKQAQLNQEEADEEAGAAAAKEEEITAIWYAQQRVQTEWEASVAACDELEEELVSVQ